MYGSGTSGPGDRWAVLILATRRRRSECCVCDRQRVDAPLAWLTSRARARRAASPKQQQKDKKRGLGHVRESEPFPRRSMQRRSLVRFDRVNAPDAPADARFYCWKAEFQKVILPRDRTSDGGLMRRRGAGYIGGTI